MEAGILVISVSGTRIPITTVETTVKWKKLWGQRFCGRTGCSTNPGARGVVDSDDVGTGMKMGGGGWPLAWNNSLSNIAYMCIAWDSALTGSKHELYMYVHIPKQEVM